MVDGLPAPRTLLEETDWSRLEHGGGLAAPETLAKLAGLMSGDAEAATIALDHLWNDLLHQGSLYSATPAAALYAAAVLGESKGGESLTTPHRIKLLEWLAEAAYAVSLSRERQLEEWFGSAVMDRNPLFGEMKAIRPVIFREISPYVSDSDRGVMEAALLAAVHLLDAPELSSHVEEISPKVRSVLAASDKQGYRDAAISQLEAWGEEVESLKHAAGATGGKEDSWDEFWGSDRGSPDDSPF
ncbi:hypothetical protein ACSCBZ_04575 [Streptomyces niveiscabiei]|uniref:hypothetical protein n=1 Tax=Streptomyces TaxID=1883 RepID=UPI001057964C|nr:MULTISPECIES: hypothetical protein [Streptomyces]